MFSKGADLTHVKWHSRNRARTIVLLEQLIRSCKHDKPTPLVAPLLMSLPLPVVLSMHMCTCSCCISQPRDGANGGDVCGRCSSGCGTTSSSSSSSAMRERGTYSGAGPVVVAAMVAQSIQEADRCKRGACSDVHRCNTPRDGGDSSDAVG